MNDLAGIDTRPPFMALWHEHRFRIDLVARGAGVPDETVFTMLRWPPVEAQDAAKVLAELSRR
jgi:hypothetical protein